MSTSILDLYIQIRGHDKAWETNQAFWGDTEFHIWDQGMLVVRAGQKIAHCIQQ